MKRAKNKASKQNGTSPKTVYIGAVQKTRQNKKRGYIYIDTQ